MWSDILWIVIPIVFSVAVMFFVFRKAKGGKRKNFTEHTIGILRGVQRTGLYINEQPQLALTFDAVMPDGSTMPVTVKEIVSLTYLHLLNNGSAFPICYDPASFTGALDNAADQEALQDLFDRYMARRNPRGFTYEQRVTLRTRGIKRKAVLTDMRLTGAEEAGCCEVTLTVRLTEQDGSERILRRTSWMTDSELSMLAVGKIVNLEVVEDDPPWFSILQEASAVAPQG